jgi:hypothetical protein
VVASVELEGVASTMTGLIRGFLADVDATSPAPIAD